MMPHHRITLALSKDSITGLTIQGSNKDNFRNKGYRGFKMTLNLKSGSGSVVGSVSEYDDSGNATKTWATASITGTGVTILEVHPALTTSGNVYNDILGAVFNTKIVVTGTLTLDAVVDLVP